MINNKPTPTSGTSQQLYHSYLLPFRWPGMVTRLFGRAFTAHAMGEIVKAVYQPSTHQQPNAGRFKRKGAARLPKGFRRGLAAATLPMTLAPFLLLLEVQLLHTAMAPAHDINNRLFGDRMLSMLSFTLVFSAIFIYGFVVLISYLSLVYRNL